MSEISPHPRLASEGEVGPGTGHATLWGQSWGALVTLPLSLSCFLLYLQHTACCQGLGDWGLSRIGSWEVVFP